MRTTNNISVVCQIQNSFRTLSHLAISINRFQTSDLVYSYSAKIYQIIFKTVNFLYNNCDFIDIKFRLCYSSSRGIREMPQTIRRKNNMHSFINKRGFGIALSLTLALSLIPAQTLAAQAEGLCEHHSAHTTECGFFNEGGSCSFALNGCDDCREDLIPIIGTDVLIGGTSFPFTGQEIRPEITVTVAEQKLTEGEHYSLTYENN